jgi:hypothetical protein
MKPYFVFFALIAISHPALADVFHCDSIDKIGQQGQLKVDLATRSIALVEEAASLVIFDVDTFCGFRPSSPELVKCPFEYQASKDSLAVNLRCTQATETGQVLVTSGQISIRNTKGTLYCRTFGDTKIDLKLSNCRSN